MLGKTSKPVIKILTGSLVSGHRADQVEVYKSPRSETESKTQSPRGLKSYDFGGVGLGIVAALEKSGSVAPNTALFSRRLNRSNPIPVNSWLRNGRGPEEMEMQTCHGPNKASTKMYFDGVEGGRKGDDRTPFRIQNGCVFHISPARSSGELAGFPPSDFLSSCNLCHKKLHGKDIYMYRGEKAFCSTECRYRQMVMDERTEKCSSEASRPAEVAGSPYYTNGQIFTTGILAI